MLDRGHHAPVVDDWLRLRARDLGSAQLLELFEAALTALWARTLTTLGAVTLSAIADRVLYVAAEKFPALSCLEVEQSSGIECGALRERVESMKVAELKDGMRFVLVEFLTVLGNLTAEILTEDLHSELSRVGLPSAADARRGATAATRAHDEDEDTGS